LPKTTTDSSKAKPIKQFTHPEAQRVNNPPVGLVNAGNDPDAPAKTYQFSPHRDPELTWAGKAERTTFETATVSLHVHERIDPRTLIEAVRRRNGPAPTIQPSLFDLPHENPPLREAIDFYKHPHGWSNRLVVGNSLLVMNSLLEKEGLAGEVQMIYIDPPYGVEYRSNFQPFVNKRSVAETDRDDDLPQEPETITAFRDTWELGIHSYVNHLRDRFFLAKELLHESGSIFVQISDENVHLVRCLLDEVFGAKNLVVTIPVKKKGSQRSGLIDPVNDYVVWYTKASRKTDAAKIKFHTLFHKRELDAETLRDFRLVEMSDYRIFPVSALPDRDGIIRDYRLNPRQIAIDHPGARIFKSEQLLSGGERKNQSLPFVYDGRGWPPGPGRSWKHTVQTVDGSVPGMQRLADARRIYVADKQLSFKRFLDDFGYVALSNWWELGGAPDPIYVVQTNPEIIERCMLMTTDPGDLVLDPTCGSGTTAVVAEKWGRRWITCDTSRVAAILAKGRLATAVFDYYELAHPSEGIRSGFNYRTVPHVTSSTIANDEPPKQEVLYDQPAVDRSKLRVAGPFTVEAVPSPTVRPIVGLDSEPANDESIARDGPTLRHQDWRAQLLRSGVRARGGQRIAFTRVEPAAGTRHLHAQAETAEEQPRHAVITFGSEYAPLDTRQVQLAWEEAQSLAQKPALLLFAAFQFDPEAAKDIDELDPQKTGMTFLKVQMDTDLLTEDLKKRKSPHDQSFWLIGQPDVQLSQVVNGVDAGKFQIEVRGFDYYDPQSGQIESGDASKIAVWELDTDYDGRSLFPRQVFFTVGVLREGLQRLAKTLQAEIDPDKITAYTGSVSLPFEPGKFKRVAVKIVDNRGIESLKVVEID
jgi:adenine-specific DNA-methyltransferase